MCRYACGKVCLSLLGTWSGPSWQPGVSSLLQVCVCMRARRTLLGEKGSVCVHMHVRMFAMGKRKGAYQDGDLFGVGMTERRHRKRRGGWGSYLSSLLLKYSDH